MKKLLIFLFLFVFASSLYAQEKGDMMVSGSFSLNSKSTKNKLDGTSVVTKGDRSFSIMPEFHYFVCDGLSVGLGLGYSLEKEPNGRSDGDDQLFNKKGLFLFQPKVSYYVSLSDKFYFVPSFYLGAGVGKYKQEVAKNEVEEKDLSSLYVGLSLLSFEFRPTDCIGLRFNAGDLSYQAEITKESDDNKRVERDFNLGLNLGASIAFNIYF